ncbi:YadA-like family protein [Burkholderia pyrrocinia]
MNKSYRTVWNATTGTWVAAEETARSKSKGSSRVARKAFVAVTLGGVAIGGASAADFGDALESTGGSGDEESVVRVPITGTKSQMNARSIGTDAIGTMAAIDDTYIKIRSGLYGPARPAVAAPEGDGAIAIGASATATGISSLALGGGAIANTTNAMAIGTIARATGTETLAAGVGSAATATYSSALGRGATATAEGSTALGSFAVANRANTVSVGNATTQRQITNLAAGTQNTDAVNVQQLNAAIAAADDPYVAFRTGTYAAARAAQATGDSSTAIGPNARATGSSAVALGGNSTAGSNSVALGTISNAAAEATAVGVSANAQANNSTAVGRLASATATGAVALGNGAVADRANTVSVGSAAGRRAIVNMAAGTQATDAVNVSQLTPIVTALGGGATINATTGAVTGPTYNLTNGGRQTTVGGALTALDNALTTSNRFVKVNGTTDATANGAGSIAIGSGATTTPLIGGSSTGQTAIGNEATANGLSSTALGSSAEANGTGALAAGRLSNATGNSSTALGNQASAQAGGATALGNLASVAAGATNSVAIGNNASVTENVTNAMALGTNAIANRNDTISVGSATQQRQITNLAAGTQDTDAVNLAQLNAAIANVGSDSPYFQANGAGDGSDAASAVGAGSVAVGSNASTVADGGVAIGNNAKSEMQNGVAIGNAAVASEDGVAIGRDAHAQSANSLAFGAQSSAAANGTSLGFNAKAADNAMALGANTVAAGSNSVALGNGSVASVANTVSVGSAGNERKIVNVADGDLSATSTDAVNGSQLFATNTRVGSLEDSLKGGGVIDPTTGESLAVVYDGTAKDKVTLAGGATGTTIANVKAGVADMDAVNVSQLKDSGLIGNDGKAIAAVTYDRNADGTPNYGSVTLGDGNGPVKVTNVADATGDSDALNLGQLKQAGLVGEDGQGNLTSLAVAYDDASKGTVTLGGGAAGTTITNVKAGDLSATSTDAVNGSQLFATNQSVGDLRDSLQNGGVIDPVTGQSLAVTYDDATKAGVTLGNAGTPVAIHNVAAGDLSATSTDAVNGSQLFATNTRVGSLEDSLQNGGVIDPVTGQSLAVVYDDATKAGVTLGNAGTPVAIHNVAAGDLSATSTDAVNGSQLFATNQSVGDLRDSLQNGGVIDPTTGESLAVVYDSAAKNHVTLGGAGASGPVTLSNVAAGVAATDAVNVQQMQQAVATGNPYIGGRGTGVAAQATGINAVALGLGSLANEINTISVGNSTTGLQRRITNVQNGEADSDAATVGQVNELMGVASTSTQAALDNIDTKTTSAIQDVNSRLDAINTVAGTDPYVQVDGAGDGSDNASVRPGTYGVAIGAEANATGNTAIAIGAQSVSSGNSSVALGAGASATATGAVAFGSGRATGTSALALGNGTNASGNNAVAAGFNAGASGLNALAFGNTARANATDSMAFGTTAQVDPLATNGIAIGRAANVTSAAQNSVALGSNSVADRLNSISVGSTSQQRQIIYVSKGTADTDAVNVSQLKDAVSAFGGNASVGADGSIVNPTYTFDGATYHNVGDALNALAQRGGGSDPLAVTYAKNPDGSANFDLVSLAGVDGTTLTNLKAGALSATSTDAVNGSQLFATNERVGSLEDSLQNGGVIDPTTGESLAVVYDGTAKDKVTLAGGATGTTISNVKAGVADMDAVNVSQLKDSGLIGNDGKAIAAVTYDRNPDGTANYGSVTLGNGNGPVKVSNVADATGDSDALNLGQLKQAGLVGEDGQGNLTSLAVAYDDASKGTVTLGGGAAGTTITNVKAGELSATSTDAVNGSQLFATNQDIGDLRDSLQSGGVIDPTTGESLAVVYDGTAKDKVTLAGGATGTTISNVKAGVADMDAVNVSQLKDSGLIGNDGKAIAAVTYDRNTDGTPNYGSVTLGDGNGPVKVTNVADATGDSDALNLGQLKQAGLVGEDGQGNLTSLAVAYDDASKDKVTLAGGATGTTITNVKAGELSATSTDAVNGSQLFATNQDLGDLRDSLQSGGVIDPTTGESLAVVYDSTAKDKVTLAGGATGTTISNVKAGVADLDAVNVSQLKGSGLIDPVTGQSIAAVTYDRNPDGTANYGSVTLGNGNGPVKVSNVADATGDSDALNLGQLKQAGLVGEDGQGNLTSLAVAYDDASKGTVTLGGGAAGTTITNVKAGELSATSTDAVNGSQLFATNTRVGSLEDSLQNGGVIDPVTGESLAVVYDSTAKDKVTLAGGATGTTISNVKAGVADLDAVNVSQLKGSGLIDPVTGQSIAAVTYDRLADGTANYGSVTLGNGNGPVKVSNVAAATADTDAVNYGQMKDYVDGSIGVPGNPLAVAYDDTSKGSITLGGANGTTITNVAAGEVSATSTDAINGSQLHGVSQSVADSLGGGSTVGADGTVTNPTYSLADPADASQKHDYHNVGDALANLDGRVVDNTTNITVIKNQLSDSGLVDPVTGQSIAAVTYDRNADGTPNYNSATLRGTDGTTLSNVKAGVADLDAVNVSQLKGSGLIDPVTGQSIAAVTYDRNPDGTANYGSVTLGNGNGPVKVTNVADATGDSDALNLGQLKQAGLVGEDGQGNLTSLAVAYDDASKGTVTLGGGAAGTTITNVKAGELSATSTDAVNGSQLFATNQDIGDLRDSLKGGGVIDPVTGESLAVVYDSAAKNQVTLGGANATTPVQLKNVAAGTDGTDAVNVAQLKEAGLVAPVDPTNPGAGLTSLAVTYGDASKSTVALGGANGTTLSNVAAGAVSATSTDAINGSQLHGVSQSVADSLGGGSTVGADGTVTNPTYSLADPADASQKHDYHNVGDALANLDGRVVDNTTNITVIKNQLADSGLVDPVTGQSIAAVTYDRNTDGTPNYGSVTLGNGNDPVKVSNVADGVDRHDAVNLGQLQDAGLVAPVDPTNPGTMTSLAVTYGKNTDGTANFDQVVLAGKGGTTISNVKAGAVTATSTDAINGAQLHGVSQSVADSLGGGSTVDADGKVTSPTYVVNNQTFNNVGDAITNISNSLVDGSIGLVQQDATTRDITVAKDTDGTVVDFTGTAGDRVLTGVAAGAVNATSNDAINGSQLHGTAQSVADVIGGGTTVDADGKLADTAIDVNGQKYSTVAEAVQAAAAYGATDSLAVRYDLNGDGTPNFGSVTLGGSGAAPVQLKNVADGVNKYDAVNFGQLSELNDKIDDMDGRVGALEQNPGNGGGTGDSPYFSGTDVTPGSSTAANAGTGTGNTAAGSGASVGGGANNATVIGSNASATKDNGAAIGSGAKSTGEGATAIGSNASASGSQSVAIGSGSVANEANTVSFGNGTDDGNRRIVNIADGINANDAASKGQLDRAVGGLQGQINDVSKNAYSGIAAATALTMIPGVDPGKTLSFGVGGATYKGYQAVAFGGEARITQNLKMKAGVGLSSGGNTVGVGASYQW